MKFIKRILVIPISLLIIFVYLCPLFGYEDAKTIMDIILTAIKNII